MECRLGSRISRVGQQAVPQQAELLLVLDVVTVWSNTYEGNLSVHEALEMCEPGSGCIASGSGAVGSVLCRRFLLPRLPRRLPFGFASGGGFSGCGGFAGFGASSICRNPTKHQQQASLQN